MIGAKRPSIAFREDGDRGNAAEGFVIHGVGGWDLRPSPSSRTRHGDGSPKAERQFDFTTGMAQYAQQNSTVKFPFASLCFPSRGRGWGSSPGRPTPGFCPPLSLPPGPGLQAALLEIHHEGEGHLDLPPVQLRAGVRVTRGGGGRIHPARCLDHVAVWNLGTGGP